MTLAALLVVAAIGWRRRQRGVWIGVLLAIPAVLQLAVARSAPGASYILEWPLFGGVAAFAVMMTARETISPGWRLAVLLLAPAASLLLLLPMLSPLIVALGGQVGGVVAAVAVGLVLITVTPQLVLILRRRVNGRIAR